MILFSSKGSTERDACDRSEIRLWIFHVRVKCHNCHIWIAVLANFWNRDQIFCGSKNEKDRHVIIMISFNRKPLWLRLLVGLFSEAFNVHWSFGQVAFAFPSGDDPIAIICISQIGLKSLTVILTTTLEPYRASSYDWVHFHEHLATIPFVRDIAVDIVSF